MEQKFGKNSYCALFADIEQKSPFLFAGIK